jgi:hypothetical protein
MHLLTLVLKIEREKLKIKIFAERVMENHTYSSIDFYISISKKLFL